MAADFSLKRGDTSPSLVTTLQDSDGVAVNLTGATVKFIMTPHGSTTAKVNAAAVLTTPADGVVTYNWVAADTDTHGSFKGEFEVTFSGGAKQTFPNSRYLRIDILNDLG